MAKKKNPAAVELGRKGGARSRVNLTPEARTKLAKKAAEARWKRLEDLIPAAVTSLQDLAANASDPKIRADAAEEIRKRGLPSSPIKTSRPKAKRPAAKKTKGE